MRCGRRGCLNELSAARSRVKGGRMNRREVIAGLSLPFLARSAWAQQPGRVYSVACPLAIGSLTHETAKQEPILYGPIIKELRKTGFVLGHNLHLDFPTVDGHFNRMPEVAAALVRTNPDVIFSTSNEFDYAIQKATNTIPVVAYMN